VAEKLGQNLPSRRSPRCCFYNELRTSRLAPSSDRSDRSVLPGERALAGDAASLERSASRLWRQADDRPRPAAAQLQRTSPAQPALARSRPSGMQLASHGARGRAAGRPRRPSCGASFFSLFGLFFSFLLIVCLDGLSNWSISKTSRGLHFSPIYFQ
jgi:hypothetical protein